MDNQHLLKKPIITEKATKLSEKLNQITFKVDVDANKHQIQKMVESLYQVRVTSVRTLVIHGKIKRRGQSISKRRNWKKALVTLAQGDRIDFFATE